MVEDGPPPAAPDPVATLVPWRRPRLVGSVAAGGLALFGIITMDMAYYGPIAKANIPIAEYVSGLGDAGWPVRRAGRILSWPGNGRLYGPAIVLGALACFFLRDLRRGVLVIAFGVWSEFMVNYLQDQLTPYNLAVARDEAGNLVPADFGRSHLYPSGHTTNATLDFGVAILLASQAWIRFRKMAPEAARRWAWSALLAWITIAFLTGLGRVLLGVHWTNDVLAGWALGAGFVALAVVLAGVPFRRAKNEEATSPA